MALWPYPAARAVRESALRSKQRELLRLWAEHRLAEEREAARLESLRAAEDAAAIKDQIDLNKGRVYIPQEDLARFGVAESQIAERRADAKWRDLMAFECARSRELLLSGAPLGRALPGRFGLEIRATVFGGVRILDKIDAVSGDVFRHRPVLKAADWIAIIAKAI